MSEPAVVHYKHFNACLGGFARDVKQLVCVEVEVGRFPVVDENGTADILPLATGEVVAHYVVECAAHVADTVRGEYHDYFRSLEFLAEVKVPAEIIRVDSGEHTGLFVLVHLAACNEASGVAQREAVAVTVVLGSLVVNDGDEVIVSVAC